MRDMLLDHLTQFSPISAQQWGFCWGKSANCALLAAIDLWHQWLDSGLDICAVFFDYKKAFDSVPHRPLIDKVKGHKYKYQSQCSQMDHGIPHFEDSICVCEWCIIPPLTCLFQCVPVISYWPLAAYLLHQRYYLDLTVRWHPFIVCG